MFVLNVCAFSRFRCRDAYETCSFRGDWIRLLKACSIAQLLQSCTENGEQSASSEWGIGSRRAFGLTVLFSSPCFFLASPAPWSLGIHLLNLFLLTFYSADGCPFPFWNGNCFFNVPFPPRHWAQLLLCRMWHTTLQIVALFSWWGVFNRVQELFLDFHFSNCATQQSVPQHFLLFTPVAWTLFTLWLTSWIIGLVNRTFVHLKFSTWRWVLLFCPMSGSVSGWVSAPQLEKKTKTRLGHSCIFRDNSRAIRQTLFVDQQRKRTSLRPQGFLNCCFVEIYANRSCLVCCCWNNRLLLKFLLIVSNWCTLFCFLWTIVCCKFQALHLRGEQVSTVNEKAVKSCTCVLSCAHSKCEWPLTEMFGFVPQWISNRLDKICWPYIPCTELFSIGSVQVTSVEGATISWCTKNKTTLCSDLIKTSLSKFGPWKRSVGFGSFP